MDVEKIKPRRRNNHKKKKKKQKKQKKKQKKTHTKQIVLSSPTRTLTSTIH